jgi:chemotaxis protein histidine kinase CheA
VTAEITAELYPVFVTFRDETKVIREEMTADLLTLEAAGDATPAGLFERIVRNAHTLKGNSSSLGLEEVASLMHSVESLLTSGWARDGRFDATTVDLVLLSIDEVLRRRAGS